MIWGRRTLLDDPVVTAWDAAPNGTRTFPNGADASDVSMIASFLALDALPAPSARFVEQLGQQIADLDTPPRRAGSVKRKTASPRAIGKQSWLARVDLESRLPRPRNRSFLWGALPLVTTLLLISAFAVYWANPRSSEPAAIPAATIIEPQLDTFAQIDFDPPMWGMPSAADWQHFESGMFEVAPDSTFTTDAPWFMSVDGPLVFTALSGDLSMTPAGPAFLYSAHQHAQAPIEISPGETIHLRPDDTIIFASQDTAVGKNPGIEPITVLYGLVGVVDDSYPNAMQKPKNVMMINYDCTNRSLAIPTAGATLSLQRIELLPYGSQVIDIPADPRLMVVLDPFFPRGLRVQDGPADALSPTILTRSVYGAIQVRTLGTGPHTVFNLGEETIDLYVFVVEPYPNPAASISMMEDTSHS